MRSRGISTLIACQNEEATVGWCILSFLDFSDEIIVVDNGSTDASKDICREMARRYPEKVSFHDVPHLKDLYENRQYAFERSHYNWIVRADADYICYTDGEYDCRNLREHLVSQSGLSRPSIYYLFHPNVHGDLWHTGADLEGNGMDAEGRQVGNERFKVVCQPMPRIYRWFPGFRFDRLGRWEGVRTGRLMSRIVRHVRWPEPIWLHINVKSPENMLFRSERTNWRELGNFERYPTLESYLLDRINELYGTSDLLEASERYVEQRVLPFLAPYQPDHAYPYPLLAQRAMEEQPVYRIEDAEEHLVRLRACEPVEAPRGVQTPSGRREERANAASQTTAHEWH